MKKLFLFLITLALCVPVFAQGGQWTFTAFNAKRIAASDSGLIFNGNGCYFFTVYARFEETADSSDAIAGAILCSADGSNWVSVKNLTSFTTSYTTTVMGITRSTPDAMGQYYRIYLNKSAGTGGTKVSVKVVAFGPQKPTYPFVPYQ